ncbi:hypothetical protein [Halalkalicoccus tibetensis]|uniref:Uncharacterized protein n=1 Tax=Halalkalicoccus tibetensis TaxID=175632 RepID=A0ABD5UWM0_9EURY
MDYEELFQTLPSDEKDEESIENAKTIVSYLFPRARSRSFSNLQIRENNQTYNKRRRICDPEVIDHYLRQVVPDDKLRIDEFDSFHSHDNKEDYASAFEDLVEQGGEHGRTKANQLLDQTSLNDIENVKPFFYSLFIVGDDLIRADPSYSALDRGSNWVILEFIDDILESMVRDVRGGLLDEAISEGDSVYLPVFYIESTLREHGVGGGDPEPLEKTQRMLTQSQIDSLKNVVVSKIEQAADENQLESVPNLDRVLLKWEEWSTSNQAKEWVSDVSTDTDSLLVVLNSFISQSRYASAYESGTQSFVDIEYVLKIIDLSDLKEWVSSIDKEDLEKDEADLIRIYEKGFELYEAGAATDDPSTWRTSERILDSGSEES